VSLTPIQEVLTHLDGLASPVFVQYPLPWQATTSYPPYISIPAVGEKGVHYKITEALRKEEALFLTALVNAWPQLRRELAMLGATVLPQPGGQGSKAPLAHREAARDLCYALRDVGPLDTGPGDSQARELILAAFAKITA
jgi:hypothetical protein